VTDSPLTILPLEHYPTDWEVDAVDPLSGAIAVGFTPAGTAPDDTTVWWSTTWSTGADTDRVRTCTLVIAGSDATTHGVHPGLGAHTTWLRYTAAGNVRTIAAGTIRFR
jgi:hypothetical protein